MEGTKGLLNSVCAVEIFIFGDLMGLFRVSEQLKMGKKSKAYFINLLIQC